MQYCHCRQLGAVQKQNEMVLINLSSEGLRAPYPLVLHHSVGNQVCTQFKLVQLLVLCTMPRKEDYY